MSREAKGRPWDAQGAPREGQGDVKGGQSGAKGRQGEPKGRPCQARPGPGPKQVSPHNRKYASRHSRGGVFVGSDQGRGGFSRRDLGGGGLHPPTKDGSSPWTQDSPIIGPQANFCPALDVS